MVSQRLQPSLFCIQSAGAAQAVLMRPVGHPQPSWGEWQSLAWPAGTFRGHYELRWLPDSEVKLQRGLIWLHSCSVSLKDFAPIKMMERRPACWLCRLISLSDLLLLWKSQPGWAGWGFVWLASSGQVPHLWCWYFAGLRGSHLAYKPQTSAGVMVGLLAHFSRGGDLLY